jgi:hypothetical protein
LSLRTLSLTLLHINILAIEHVLTSFALRRMLRVECVVKHLQSSMPIDSLLDARDICASGMRESNPTTSVSDLFISFHHQQSYFTRDGIHGYDAPAGIVDDDSPSACARQRKGALQ